MAAPGIAIVSLACRYPEADDPAALWRNALAGRRAFRAMPPSRLDLAAYAAELVGPADSITPIKAGLLADWSFDRGKFRIPAGAFAATDLTHWLALQVAEEAIGAAGGVQSLRPERTAVVVANTLTGEFSRAGLLRMRLPFLDAVLRQAADEAALDEAAAAAVRRRFAEGLCERFPAPGEETLSGGLANTIAGRIANFFDLKGGAYSVDAACASSLVAITDAAEILASGRADAVVVGAVDLSLDPFELVGFSRNGALASGEMRVFDARSDGFWPGEGAGFAVLVRESDARAQGAQPLAVLRGWGLSSDGAGGLTRPTVEGQALALRRAHQAAGVDPEDIDFVEAHGTGTAAGDPVEVRALAQMHAGGRRLPIGSIKANIGHTKAAAGFAGLIKAVGSLRAGVLAPHVSCERPHGVFDEVDGRVRPALEPELLADRAASFAGVSSFGFGGVNAHLIVEGRRPSAGARPVPVAQPDQDAELFVFRAKSAPELAEGLARLRERATSLGWSELADAAAAVANQAAGAPETATWRAAVTASRAEDLVRGLDLAAEAAGRGAELFDPGAGVFVGQRASCPRIGLLFPGQGAPLRRGMSAWARRFAHLRPLLQGLPAADDRVDTAAVQPNVVAASAAGVEVLSRFGIGAIAGLGHSVGELSALAWSGAIAADDVVGLAVDRGRIMAAFGEPGGAMLRLSAGADAALGLAQGLGLALACENGEAEVVLAGPAGAVEAMSARARDAGVEATRLAVSHAFHSPMMQPAMAPWRRRLEGLEIGPPVRRMASSITGDWLKADAGLRAMLEQQLVRPVAFADALRRICAETDLLIEVGAGTALSRLAAATGAPAISVDALGASLEPLLTGLGAAFVMGAPVDLQPLFADRSIRPLDLDRAPVLISGPCGRLGEVPAAPAPPLGPRPAPATPPIVTGGGGSVIEVVRSVVAGEAGLPEAALSDSAKFLSDLHLNSLAVGRIAARSARLVGVPPFLAPTEFADASLEMLAGALEERLSLPPVGAREQRIAGVRRWVRPYAVRWRAAPDPEPSTAPVAWRPIELKGRSSDAPYGPAEGALVHLDGPPDESLTQALITQIQAALRCGAGHLAIRHGGWPLSAFARSLALELDFKTVRLIEAARDDPRLERELSAAVEGYAEVRLAADGPRQAPQFVPVKPAVGGSAPLTPEDTVLVVGGARGIAAECALRLAETTGCALLLCGRSGPDDQDVAAILQRATARALRCRYLQADALDEASLRRLIPESSRSWGSPTVLIHAPGVNEPVRLKDLTADRLSRTMAVKTAGLRAAVAAAGPRLRRVMAFGSIIGRIGLAGEAHYALANAWQSMLMEQMKAAKPDCAFLALEWTVWGGVGMGERLGAIERLAASGVDALNVDDAVETFEWLVADGAVGILTVTSRFGPPPNLDLGPPPPASLRFQDDPVISFPGVELVLQTELSFGRDAYLRHHSLDGRAVLPAVMALEAMAQGVEALAPTGRPLAMEEVRFARAVTLEAGESQRIRIAGLGDEDGAVEACIRSEDDDFVEPCVSARFRAAPPPPPDPRPLTRGGAAFEAASLYGPLFFQTGPFRRLARFETAASRDVAAMLAPASDQRWFSAFEPQRLLLGDPGARDAALHALQAAVPHKRVIPTSVERISCYPGGAPARVRAFERAADGSSYTFDIFIEDASGQMVEAWRGARFSAIGALDVRPVLAAQPMLASAYLERLGRELLQDDSLEAALACAPRGAGEPGQLRGSGRAEALRTLGIQAPARRSDGRPLAEGGRGLSLAHQGDWTLALASRREAACDIALIGADPPPGLSDATPLTQLQAWCVSESLRKLGRFDAAGAWRQVPTPAAPSDAAMFVTNDGARILTARVPAGADDVLVALAVAPARRAPGAGHELASDLAGEHA